MNAQILASHYPDATAVDHWLDSIWQLVTESPCQAEILSEQGFTHNLGLRHLPGCQYVRFSRDDGEAFYGYWQPDRSTPAPLIVHVPGYGAEMSAHPDLVAAGFSVLHVSPLGYSTPQGADLSRQRNDTWPVLPDTLLSGGKGGYRRWLADAATATCWALQQPETLDQRVSFCGSSQGGGGSLLMASLFRDRGARCAAADVPFLTNFVLGWERGAYSRIIPVLEQLADPAAACHAVGLIDTTSHLHRLHLPVLLTAASEDGSCPPDTIEDLFRRLPATRSYSLIHNEVHRYTKEFIPLATAWFRMYA